MLYLVKYGPYIVSEQTKHQKLFRINQATVKPSIILIITNFKKESKIL